MKTKKTTKFKGKCGSWLGVIVFSMMILLGVEAGAAEKSFDFSSQTLRVGVWVDGLADGEVLDRSEEVTVGFQANEDAYAVVYRINTEGLVTVLWPRSRMDDGFVFGGHEYLLPVSGARRLVASNRTGEGFIEAIISRHPFDLRDLPLDFHHEFQAEDYDFHVNGDPYLAMNEVNFAVTGMEDSKDFVVTNYLSYYVHEQVEHPRYLCNQCHMDDGLAMNPYQDHCTIEITYDYGWGNQWYNDFGYYPVYHNPVYVYVDPWTWRPWVNFWYEPYYVCSTWPRYNWHNPAYVWCDSPYYRDYSVRYKTGRGLYTPDRGRPGQSDPRRKTSDYSRISGQIAQRGPTGSERDIMVRKERTDRKVRSSEPNRANGGIMVARGEKPMLRPRPSIDSPTRTGSRGGLQIRESSDRKQVTGPGRSKEGRATSGVKNPIRRNPGLGNGTSGTVRTYPAVPDRGTSEGGPTTVRGSSRSNSPRGSSANVSRSRGGDGKIKPVEPRKKGTRIWNSRSGSQSDDRSSRSSVRNNSSNNSVRPRSTTRDASGSTTRSSGQVKPKPRSGSSATRSNPKTREPSKVRSNKNSSSKSSSSSSGSSKSSTQSSKSKSGRDSGSSRSKR